MQTRQSVVLAAVLSSAVLSIAAQAQCVPALRGFSSGPIDIGTLGNDRSYITTLMPFDDGSGSALFAAGRFRLSPSAYSHVAKYQSGTWTPMPIPAASPSNVVVTALAVHDFSSVSGPAQSMYALASAQGVYRRNGAQWEKIGTLPAGGFSDSLLATSDAQGPVLLVTRAGENDGSPRVLAWRGTGGWSAYGTLGSGFVTRLRTVDDGTGPATYALGSFSDPARGITNIAKFVNGEWAAVPFPETTNILTDITTYDDGTHGPELYLSGVIYATNGPLNAAADRVYRQRDGAWLPVEAGDLFGDHFSPAFLKLDEGDGEKLYLAGYLASGQQSGLFQLTASGWQAPLFLRPSDQTTTGAIFAGVRFEEGGINRTFLGGDFVSFASSMNASYSANINTRGYSLLQSDPDAPLGYRSAAVGLGEPVTGFSNTRYCLSPVSVPEGPRMLVTGGFNRAGGQRVLGAALFDGQAFAPLDVVGTSVGALQDAIYVPVDGVPRILAAAPDSSLGPVAYWNGSQWQRLPQQPPYAVIYTLAALNNEPVALMSNNLCVYRNGAWQVVTSLSPGSHAGIVGDLGQGARFYFSDNGAAGLGVYQFDGQAVSLVGTTPTFIGAMTVHDDGSGPKLYASRTGGIGRFNGSDFEVLPGGGLLLQGGNLSLASFDDGLGPALYAAGGFSKAGGQDVNGFARWRNNQWEPVASYVPPVPSTYVMGRTSMAVFNDRLYLAGDFISIGNVSADRLVVIEPCPGACSADYNHDGDVGTDLDIEAFFACLSGDCCVRCVSDFNNDGDFGTDADIESFFRVLAGGPC